MKDKKATAIIEARMASMRLKEKMLKPLSGIPLLQRVVERIKPAKYINRIVLATTTKPNDDILIELAKKLEIDCFRGSEEDVLGRLAGAVTQFNPETVVCLTGDNPLVDSQLIDDVVNFFYEGSYDYVTNTHMYYSDLWKAERTFPVGVSIQVVKASVFLEVDREITDTSKREHGTFSIYHRNDKKYKLGAFLAEGPYKEWRHPELRFTVDTPEDYELMNRIFAELYPCNPHFSTSQAIRLLLNNPSLRLINSGIQQQTV